MEINALCSHCVLAIYIILRYPIQTPLEQCWGFPKYNQYQFPSKLMAIENLEGITGVAIYFVFTSLASPVLFTVER